MDVTTHSTQRETNLREAEPFKLEIRHPWEGCLFGKIFTCHPDSGNENYRMLCSPYIIQYFDLNCMCVAQVQQGVTYLNTTKGVGDVQTTLLYLTKRSSFHLMHSKISLENVEHCGGEPEQADTGILCH